MLQKKFELNFWFALILFAFVFQACGLSSEDIKKQEQQLIDSTQKATKEQTLQKVNDEQQLKDRQNKLKMEQQRKDMVKTNIKNEVQKLTTELEVQQLKLEDIQKPKFLRTPDEKEQQVRNQVSLINSIKQKIENLNEVFQKIDTAQDYKTLLTTIK